jgi:2-haloacid dehalogenase
MSLATPPKALLTDVFGTVVNWRASVTDHLTSSASAVLNNPNSSLSSALHTTASSVSWSDFAQAWRVAYYHFTRSYNPETSSFTTIDRFFRTSLEQLVDSYGITGLWTSTELDSIAQIWHRLDGWPDSAPGLALLTKHNKFQTATLSNGNTALLTSLATHGGLPYTHILSAEHFGAYKPNPRVYLGAAEKLGLHSGECAMVAAHLGDLEAARKCGMQTIYIERKEEEGWDAAKANEAKEQGWVDMWVNVDEPGFLEVARRFGV